VTQGDVVATNPAANSPVKSGTAIELITSSGYCNVVVPNVVDQVQTAAQQAIAGQGLVPSFVTTSAGCTSATAGQVIAQSDAPGSSVQFGSTVVLSVCPASAG
jgi:beta-lactam-binding protein with PASTA domain